MENKDGRCCNWSVDQLFNALFRIDVGSSADMASFELVRISAVYDLVIGNDLTEVALQKLLDLKE